MKFFENRQDAEMYMKNRNKTLTKKCFHKYFKVLIDGPENNYAVVDFKTAYDMGVSYSVSW
jgi:hypothetical protein